MILVGIIGLCLVAILWVLLYFCFIRRTDRFMENWEKEIKEKAEKATRESIQSLEEAAVELEASLEGIQSLEEAAEAIKASRKAIEELGVEKGFIPKPPSKRISTAQPVKEPELEPIASPSPSFQFARYESRKHKEWEPWILSRQPVLSSA